MLILVERRVSFSLSRSAICIVAEISGTRLLLHIGARWMNWNRLYWLHLVFNHINSKSHKIDSLQRIIDTDSFRVYKDTKELQITFLSVQLSYRAVKRWRQHTGKLIRNRYTVKITCEHRKIAPTINRGIQTLKGIQNLENLKKVNKFLLLCCFPTIFRIFLCQANSISSFTYLPLKYCALNYLSCWKV